MVSPTINIVIVLKKTISNVEMLIQNILDKVFSFPKLY